MPDPGIFCNTPWYEMHVYWDGGFGICCQEDHRLYTDHETYNIKKMSIGDWFNSEPVRQFRLDMLQDQRTSTCTRCYIEEDHGGESRRIRANQKSIIFKQAFHDSYQQSPGLKRFQYSDDNAGRTETVPIDLHIDLGNFCNLACKMCNSQASSAIASQRVRWGIESDRTFLGQDWTRDDTAWQRFLEQMIELPGLNNIHFMGGETLLTDRLENLVDYFIEHKRFDLCFSFVTNGTVFRPELIDKLKRFRRVGIEISIETITAHNSYVRQGTDTALVLKNIEQYQKLCDGKSVTVTLRPAPSLLTIGYIDTLLKYALEKEFVVKGNVCYDPRFLDIRVLPGSVKSLYKSRLQLVLDQLSDVNTMHDFNSSDPNQCRAIVKNYALMCMKLLDTDAPANQQQLLEELVDHCRRWDKVYNLDARSLYPELADILDRHGY